MQRRFRAAKSRLGQVVRTGVPSRWSSTPGYNFATQNVWDGGTSIWATGSGVFDKKATTFTSLTPWTRRPTTNSSCGGRATRPAHAELQGDGDGVNGVKQLQSCTSTKNTQYVERMTWTTSGGLCSLSLYFDTYRPHHPPRDHVDCRAERAGLVPERLATAGHFFMRRYSTNSSPMVASVP